MGTLKIDFAGKQFYLDDAEGMDAVAEQMASGLYEPPLPLLMMATFIRTDGIFLDVGANTGLYSVMANAIMPEGKIVAFEPMPKALEVLRRNLSVNNMIENIVVHEVALSDESGTATLYLPDPQHGLMETSASLESGFQDAHSTINVPVKRLDDIPISETIAVIKVDIEGHEHAFLRGARETINRDRPIIFAEVLAPAKRGAIGSFLHSAGYMDFRLRPDMAIHDGEVMFDNEAWNHALVPRERLEKFKEFCDLCELPVLRRFQLS